MKHTRTTFIFIMFSIAFFNLSYSQSFATLDDDTVFVRYRNHDELSYHTDTIVFMPNQRNMLFGTTLLPFTKNQRICENYGLTVDKVVLLGSDVTFDAPKQPSDRVVNVLETDDSLIVEIEIEGNCEHSFLCDVQVLNNDPLKGDDNTLNLITIGYGQGYGYAGCKYRVLYRFLKSPTHLVIKQFMVNSDKQTITKR